MKMNYEALFLFLIILLGLLLCSFLGGNCNNEGFTGKYVSEFEEDLSQDLSNNGTTNYDNYNHYQGSSTALTTGSVYYGPNGGTITVIPNSNGTQSLQIVLVSGENPVVYTPSTTATTYIGNNGTATVFYGPNGGQATVIQGKNGLTAIRLKVSSGVYLFTPQTNSELSSSQYYGSTGYTEQPQQYGVYSGILQNGSIFYGPNGGVIVVTTNESNTQILQVTLSTGQQPVIFVYQPPISGNPTNTTYYGPNGSTATVMTINNEEVIQINTTSGIYTFTPSNNTSTNSYYTTTPPPQPNPYYTTPPPQPQQNPYYTTTQYYNPYGDSATSVNGAYGGSATSVNGAYGGSAGSITTPSGNTAYYAQGPYGNTVAGTTANSSTYTSSLPTGIPASQIPPGSEDLYILKSEVVPPVCPACPTVQNSNSSSSSETCPPCPACERCPEPAFECKKVPNYDVIDNEYLPVPVLNNFSTFGM